MKTINVYEFNELNDDAKKKAIEFYRDNNYDREIPWMEETIDSLRAIIDNSGLSLDDWSLGTCNSWIRVGFTEDIEDISGKRAISWLENNLLNDLRVPYYGKKRKDLAQYGKYYRPGKIPPCPFTGYCGDDDFLYSLIEDINSGMTIKDSFENLACKCQEIISGEEDYQNSDEYIAEFLENNSCEYTQEGRVL